MLPGQGRSSGLRGAPLCFLSRTIHAIIHYVMPNQESVGLPGCAFCAIVRGSAPSSSVYTDNVVVAFMDIQPVNEGHILVVPRVHAACLEELDAETGAHLFRVAMMLSRAVRLSAVRSEGVNLFLADGEAAGQEVFHVHLHVIPRYRGDGFGFRFGADYHVLPERARLDEIAAGIRRALEAGPNGA
jgi:histidine triad (HIT) family protein